MNGRMARRQRRWATAKAYAMGWLDGFRDETRPRPERRRILARGQKKALLAVRPPRASQLKRHLPRKLGWIGKWGFQHR